MFSRRQTRPEKPLSLWNEDEVQQWLEKHDFCDLLEVFKDNHVDGKYLCDASGQLLEGAVVSNKEHLLTAVYELKSLGDQPVSTSPWKTPPVFSSLNSQSSDSVRNSPVKLVGFTEDRTPDIASALKVHKWRRSYSLTPETKRGGAHASQGLLRYPTRFRMANTDSQSARSSMLLEGVLRASVSSPLLTKQGMIKVYGGVLRPEIEYKTVAVFLHTSAKELISLVLEKYDCPTRDPNLYYIVMMTGNSSSVNQRFQLADDDCPLVLQTSCIEPVVRFELKALEGGLVKVYGEDFSPGVAYKSIRISDKTTAKELTELMLQLYNCPNRIDIVCLEEISRTHGTGRVLCDHELPLSLMKSWKQADAVDFHLKKRVSPDDLFLSDHLKSGSLTSFGDSGVEHDMRMTPPSTPLVNPSDPRFSEKHRQVARAELGLSKRYSDDWMPPLPEAQSFLSLSGLSVASVDTLSTAHHAYEEHSDLDHHLEFLRQRSVVEGTDFVSKEHLEELDGCPSVMSLSDLSRTQLKPQDVAAMSEQESKKSGSSAQTLHSSDQTPEVSPMTERRDASCVTSSGLTLYDIMTTSRLMSLDCHIHDRQPGISLMSGRSKDLHGNELLGGTCVRVVSADSPLHQLETGDCLVEMNGINVLNESTECVASMLENMSSSELLLVVARAGGSSHYDTALIESLRSRSSEMEHALQSKSQELANAKKRVQHSMSAISDLKLEREANSRLIEQLRNAIAHIEDDKQSLKIQQTSLHQEVTEAHSRAEQAYSALRDMSQNMEQLQQQQIKRVGEAEEQRRTEEVAHKKYVNQIHALESKLQSVQSSVHKADPHLREKCRKLEAQVVQLEGHCRQLDEEVRVLKASRALLLHRLRNQEERAELEHKDRDRGFHEKHIGAQVHGVDSRIRRLLAEAQQDIKNKEDLIEGLNAALVELRRSRASEVMRLEAELVRLRRQAASREANLDGLDSGNGQELISTIHKQEKVIEKLTAQLTETQQQQQAADKRADQLSTALKQNMKEKDRRASLGDREMEMKESELARIRLESQLTNLLALVQERAPELLNTLSSTD